MNVTELVTTVSKLAKIGIIYDALRVYFEQKVACLNKS